MVRVSGLGLPAARQRKVTACARVQMPFGSKRLALCAGGNAVFYRPQHCVVVVAARRNVDKFVCPCKTNLDGVGALYVLKGVGLHYADAPAVDLDIGDGIALIRSDGEGLVSALTDADIAGGGIEPPVPAVALMV